MLNWLYEIVTRVILAWHSVFTAFGLGPDSGAAWALSIAFLTITMRLLLFPLFVKQIKSQRAMQSLQPKIKELQAKHKGDRETLNREMMAMYKEHGANPISGCLPLILQLPIFYALFHVLDRIKPDDNGMFHAVAGLSASQVTSAAKATIFGAPISSAFTSSQELLNQLGGSANATKILAVIMIVLMGISTFITQKQMMARSGPMEGQQAQIQKFMLYVLPFSFAIFGFRFPLGVLIYWLTTNVWSMGQQFFVIRRMPVAAGGGGGAVRAAGGAGTGRGAGGLLRGAGKAQVDEPSAQAPAAKPKPGARPANARPNRGAPEPAPPRKAPSSEPAAGKASTPKASTPKAGAPKTGAPGAKGRSGSSSAKRKGRRGGRR